MHQRLFGSSFLVLMYLQFTTDPLSDLWTALPLAVIVCQTVCVSTFAISYWTFASLPAHCSNQLPPEVLLIKDLTVTFNSSTWVIHSVHTEAWLSGRLCYWNSTRKPNDCTKHSHFGNKWHNMGLVCITENTLYCIVLSIYKSYSHEAARRQSWETCEFSETVWTVKIKLL